MKFSNQQKGLLFASFTAVLWGFLAILLKVVLKILSPVDVTWIRFATAFLLLFLYYVINEPRALKLLIRPPFILIIASICLGLNYFGFITGIQLTTPSIAQIFIQLGPILLAISGFLIFGETLVFKQGLGLFLVFLGLMVFYHEQIMILAVDIQKYKTGVYWVIFGAVMWTVYAIFQKKLVANYNPMQLNLALFGIPFIAYTPLVNFSTLANTNIIFWILLVACGLNTLLAYVSLSFSFKYIEVNKISVIISLNPILTFILMAIFTSLDVVWIDHENLSVKTLAGAGLVILGAILTVGKSKNKRNAEMDKAIS